MNSHTVIPMFAIPIYANNVSFPKDILDYVKTLDYKLIASEDGKISLDTYVLDDINLVKLREIIQTQVDIFLRKEMRVKNNADFYLCNSWIMKHNKGDSAPNHHHGNSIISGIMYLQCDEQSGELVFSKSSSHTNFIHPCFLLDYDEYNIFNSSDWTFSPKQGDIFLFPSFLEHKVKQSMSEDERYCVAFNLFVKGELGRNEKEDISILNIK